MKIVFPVLISFCLCGCTWNFWYKDFTTPSHRLKAPSFQMLELGMTKQQVIAAIGSPSQIISAKKEGQNLIETWEYIRMAAIAGPDAIAERYQVQFENGRLSQYDSSGDFKQQVNVR